ncbi:TFIIH complex serine/threonine-protein kinase subunit kin28 [Globomyces sp. JEL0801]|nr:TFIIH complex serine/threonine-protein kinase subunit kin28 [Globomyces sp. JEL0801]
MRIFDNKESRFSIYKQFKVDKKVGEGTYAVVYSGLAIPKDESTKQQKIAIKMIKPGMFADGLDMSAIREIKYLKELKHDNIINLIDVFSYKQRLSLVVEFLEADMETIIKNRAVVFSGADIKSWMLMMMRGDLKPNNLLLAHDGTLKIADFGLARLYGDPSHTMTSQVVTRWYRSPELLLGAKHYGGSVDVWSCGCIFAELMLRTPYFAAETDIGQLKTIMNARGTPTEKDWPGMKLLPDYFEFQVVKATPLRSIFSAAGQDALELLDTMLAYDPLKRPTSEMILDHYYFKNIPRPTNPSKLPKDTKVVTKIEKPVGLKRKADDNTESQAPAKLARKLF